MEDSAARQLPQILRQFTTSHPQVKLEIHTAVSADLLAAMEDDRIDVVLARRAHHEQQGEVVWREPLSRVVSRDHDIIDADPLPLVLFPHSCFYRLLVIEAPDAAHATDDCQHQHPASVPAYRASVRMCMSVSALRCLRTALSPELRRAPASMALPSLPMTEVAVFCGRNSPEHLTAPLTDVIREAFPDWRQAGLHSGRTTRPVSIKPERGAIM